jgi:hypothetical protein
MYRIGSTARAMAVFRLERKPMVFNVFGWLADTERG